MKYHPFQLSYIVRMLHTWAHGLYVFFLDSDKIGKSRLLKGGGGGVIDRTPGTMYSIAHLKWVPTWDRTLRYLILFTYALLLLGQDRPRFHWLAIGSSNLTLVKSTIYSLGLTLSLREPLCHERDQRV